VRALLAARAGVDLSNSAGDTALIRAIADGHVEITAALLAAGARFDAATRAGDAALIHASAKGAVCVRELLRALLERGVDARSLRLAYARASGPAPVSGAVYRAAVCAAARAVLDAPRPAPPAGPPPAALRAVLALDGCSDGSAPRYRPLLACLTLADKESLAASCRAFWTHAPAWATPAQAARIARASVLWAEIVDAPHGARGETRLQRARARDKAVRAVELVAWGAQPPPDS